MDAATKPEARDLAVERRSLLTQVLRDASELTAGEQIVDTRQLEGGWSRWSHIATARTHEGERRYVVRVKAPYGLFDTDIALEYDVFRELEHLDVPTPRAFGLTESADNPFGGEFFVMDFLAGHAPNLWRAKDHLALREDWEGGRGIANDLVATMARIHSVGAETAPASLPRVDYASHVGHWRGVYEQNRSIRDPVLEEAFDWLEQRAPADPPLGIVHGDFRMGNMLIGDGRVTAILDWELAYVGDVRFDVGYFSLDYTAGKHLRPKTDLMGGAVEREWFYEEYERLSGRALDREVVRTYAVLGLASLGAMTCVGVRHYAEGRTSDVRRVWARFMSPGQRQDMAALMEW
jgi:aminoglycoside phosphotransferase (APT) family kinase protein